MNKSKENKRLRAFRSLVPVFDKGAILASCKFSEFFVSNARPCISILIAGLREKRVCAVAGTWQIFPVRGHTNSFGERVEHLLQLKSN